MKLRWARERSGAGTLAALVRRRRWLAALSSGPVALVGQLLTTIGERRRRSSGSQADGSSKLNRLLRRMERLVGGRSLVLFEADAHAHSTQTDRRAILVSHDLSASGAPRVVVEMARELLERGFEVLVFSAADGAFQSKLQELGATVAVKQDIFRRPAILKLMAPSAEFAILNTTVCAGLALGLSDRLRVFVFLHEISSLKSALLRDQGLRRGLVAARAVWAGDEVTAEVVRGLRPGVTVMPYGLDPVALTRRSPRRGPLVVHVFGSYERRKGQDIAVKAASRLRVRYPEQFILRLNGRILEPPFFENLSVLADGLAEVELSGELDHSAYLSAMQDCDIVLVCSREDTLPLVSLDALSGGRILVCTGTTGTAAYLHDGVNGFIASHAHEDCVAAALERAFGDRQRHAAIADAARELFEENFSRDAFSNRLGAELGLEVRAPRQEFAK